MSLHRSRRRGVALLAVLAAMAFATATAPPAHAAAGDWPQAGFTAAHRRWNNVEATLTKANVSRLQPRWSSGVPVGGPADQGIGAAEAIVAGGRVFTLSVVGSFDTGYSTRVRASDPATGAQLWQRVLDGFTSAPPAVVDGRLFVSMTVVGTSADVTTVRALSPADGTNQWARVLGPSEEMSLAVEGNIVALLPSFGFGQTYTLFLLRAIDGTVRATTSGGDSDVVGIAGPTIKNGTTYFVGAGDGTPLPFFATFLQSITKSATLTPGWKSPGASAGAATPVATSEGVYLPDKAAVSLLATATGATKATMRPTAAEGHFRTPFDVAVDADRVYLGYLNGTTNVRTITAFNRFNGNRVWSKAATIAAAPAVANGVLYVAEGRNGVAAYNAATGAELWRRPGVANSAAPVVANGRLYVGWRAGADDSTAAPVMAFGV